MTNKQKQKQKQETVDDIVTEAWEMAEDYNEGNIVVQYLGNGKFLTTHQTGNSFPNLGRGWSDSKDRIVLELDCREFDIQYYDGEEKIEDNRLIPSDYEEGYYDLVHEVEESVDNLKEEDEKND